MVAGLLCCTDDATTDNSQDTAGQRTQRVTEYCPDSALLLRILYCSSALWEGMGGVGKGGVG